MNPVFTFLKRTFISSKRAALNLSTLKHSILETLGNHYPSSVFSGPPLNIPPASTGGPITTTTVPLEGQGVGGFQRRTSPGSADGPRARPISGAFSLDIDKIEGRTGGGAGQGGRSALMSRLVNHDNLDDILNGDPVVLPPTGMLDFNVRV